MLIVFLLWLSVNICYYWFEFNSGIFTLICFSFVVLISDMLLSIQTDSYARACVSVCVCIIIIFVTRYITILICHNYFSLHKFHVYLLPLKLCFPVRKKFWNDLPRLFCFFMVIESGAEN